jgi:hypothetical protein
MPYPNQPPIFKNYRVMRFPEDVTNDLAKFSFACGDGFVIQKCPQIVPQIGRTAVAKILRLLQALHGDVLESAIDTPIKHTRGNRVLFENH